MADLRWLKRIGDYDVIRREIPRPGGKPYYLNGSTLIGVLHTTEGDTVEAAWRTLRQQNAAPHFIAGENKIVQCRPLNAQASTLRPGKNNTTNVHAQVQIEMVGRSKQKLWLPKAATLDPTVAILAFCEKALGIPLRVPNDWPDDCSDMPLPWAANNRRRRQVQRGLWPKEKGWWMHLEVPYQGPTWHWDCGAVRRSRMLAMAKGEKPSSTHELPLRLLARRDPRPRPSSDWRGVETHPRQPVGAEACLSRRLTGGTLPQGPGSGRHKRNSNPRDVDADGP